MIRIAVCDDNPYELQEITTKVSSYINKWESVNKPELLSFSSGENLISEIQYGRTIDIFILDVDMPNMDGFQLAEEIRKVFPAPFIIFLTSHVEYASKGYRINAFRYIFKLNMNEEIFEALDSAVAELRAIDGRSIFITHYNECYRVPYSEIMSVQRDGRQLNVITKSTGVISDTRSVQEFYKSLEDNRFVLIDRGCIVNIDFIRKFTGSEVILTNNERFTISRRMLKQLKTKLTMAWNL